MQSIDYRELTEKTESMIKSFMVLSSNATEPEPKELWRNSAFGVYSLWVEVVGLNAAHRADDQRLNDLVM